LQTEKGEKAEKAEKEPKESKEPKAAKTEKEDKDKKDKKDKDKKKCKKAKKTPKEADMEDQVADESDAVPPFVEDVEEEEGDANLPYCEEDHCEAINQGLVLDSENKVSGSISLKVAHSQVSRDRLMAKVGSILQNETSARLAGCHDENDEEDEVPTDLAVSRAEGTEGKKILQANFYEMEVVEEDVSCKSRSADSCDTLSTKVDVIYESVDGTKATDEEAESMMRSIEQTILDQEDVGVFKGVAASVETVSTKYEVGNDGYQSERPDADTSSKRGVRPGIVAGVVVAGVGCALAAVAYNKMQHRNRDVDVSEENEGGGWIPNILAMPDNIRRSSS